MEVEKQHSSNMFSFAIGLVVVLLALETGYLHWECMRMQEHCIKRVDAFGKQRMGIEIMKWLKERLETNYSIKGFKLGIRERRDSEQQNNRKRRENKGRSPKNVLLHG